MEQPEQTEQRLRRVLTAAEFVVHEGAWYFEESPLATPPLLTGRELAVVRDDEVWSALVPWAGPARDAEVFGLFSFHFAPDLDNSGFVGWLATALKRELGTGVFVVCGNNHARGGIFDYWGCPIDLLPAAVQIVTTIRSRPSQS
ncbi:hypothetical protein EV651_10457 [Kribbella sp. VKM Ac-2571]|nr:hypothetical protein EV651_10457 [Kribbella sp. VKM Ac-2571]